MSQRKQPAADELGARLRGHLELLGLNHTLEVLDEQLAWAGREKPGAAALLEHVLGAEAAVKREQRIERRIEKSGLRERKTLETFEWAFQPSLDKGVVMELARLEFVRRKEDLVSPARAAPARATSCRRSACVPASSSSPSATLAASTCSTISTQDSPMAPTSNASVAGPQQTCSSWMTSASARSRSATTSRPPPPPSST